MVIGTSGKHSPVDRAPHGSDGARTSDAVAHDARQWAAEFVLETGLARGLEGLHFEVLSGGVSADVVAVSGPALDTVVKHALPELKVEALWRAAPSRITTEAEALTLVGALCPGVVPRVLARNDASYGIALERAPSDARNWRDQLMAGDIDLEVARELGSILARIHLKTSQTEPLRARFGDREMFEDLRIDPFYGEVARVHPHLAAPIETILVRMVSTQRCLVHGDYSPKNILVAEAGVWVLDWEVAHLGDPVFDLAFLITHLVGKSLRQPELAHSYRAAANAFLTEYRTQATAIEIDEHYLVQHVACLLLARIDGKSPLSYLDDRARREGRALAEALLDTATPTFASLWKAHS